MSGAHGQRQPWPVQGRRGPTPQPPLTPDRGARCLPSASGRNRRRDRTLSNPAPPSPPPAARSPGLSPQQAAGHPWQAPHGRPTPETLRERVVAPAGGVRALPEPWKSTRSAGAARGEAGRLYAAERWMIPHAAATAAAATARRLPPGAPLGLSPTPDFRLHGRRGRESKGFRPKWRLPDGGQPSCSAPASGAGLTFPARAGLSRRLGALTPAPRRSQHPPAAALALGFAPALCHCEPAAGGPPGALQRVWPVLCMRSRARQGRQPARVGRRGRRRRRCRRPAAGLCTRPPADP